MSGWVQFGVASLSGEACQPRLLAAQASACSPCLCCKRVLDRDGKEGVTKLGRMFYIPKESVVRVGANGRRRIERRRKARTGRRDVGKSEVGWVGDDCAFQAEDIEANNVNAFEYSFQ